MRMVSAGFVIAALRGGIASCPAQSAARPSRLSAFSSRVRAIAARIIGASGLAQRTGQTRNADAITTSARELIAHEARQARRQHRPVKPIYSRARAITHEILSRGVK